MLKEFMRFDKMITPSIIKIIFWIGVGISILSGLILIFTGLTTRFGGGPQVLMGLLVVVLGPLFARIYCELLIIFFKIHETLVEIKQKE